ncbi:MAG TPA: Rpn family recombination-promoting nuclease/putative transposase [Planctomycetota bacterium]|nr:Rpn family recombination-promoting nuclease/putative transposase [Planctomycetota bacterium]
MPEQPHDRLFRLTFSSAENALGILRAVLPPEVMAAIDPSSLELEEGSFVDEELKGQESDLLFRARLLAGRAIKVYVLVEHQNSVDPLMPFRLLRTVVSVQDRWRRNTDEAVKQLPVVIPIVFFHGPKPWSGPRSLGEILDLPEELRLALAPYVPVFEMLVDDLATQAEASLASRQAGILGRLAFVMLKAAMDGSDLLTVIARVRPLLIDLKRSPAGADGIDLILTYIMKVSDLELRTVRKQVDRVLAAGEGVMASTWDQLQEEGRVKGHLAGLRQALLRQLGKKFGNVPEATRQRVGNATTADIERWLDQVLTATTLDEVFAHA